MHALQAMRAVKEMALVSINECGIRSQLGTDKAALDLRAAHDPSTVSFANRDLLAKYPKTFQAKQNAFCL